MIRLSAFADEISPDLSEQITVLQSERIHYIDLRSMWGTNVLNLSDSQVAQIQQTLAAHGIGVAAIASPLGKVPIDSPFSDHMQRFERALELAQAFHTPFIRIFSFYPPASHPLDAPFDNWADWRDEVLRRLQAMTNRAHEVGITLVHENEKAIYGDTIDRCFDLMNAIGDTHFQAAFDPANFIQCAQVPYPDAYARLHSWIDYMHVKDALADGAVVAAGEGVADWLNLLHHLRHSGYDGFFSLEPHLAAAGQYQGFSGPDLFKRASQAFQALLREIQWEYA